ncbi:cupin domain-containing protein [Pectinatus cerevisiiphilus]|uniref:Quercetin dioxygenase-like cupin family protein n=1 Tax=Pectinatus cerevisiiphilus TaxID=86956 RepID=A0A4V2URY2_9FIRM|nr:cupin domain-containing protein [Pectinatus cerevisiiphilus]TCS79302.1 quercetin dioxygenase-like cupin family protein [Pectinatus cerevisiiphilus]
MQTILKNIKESEVLALKDLVAYQDGQVISKTLIQNDAVGITLFSFSAGEGLSTHESKGDAFVTCLDGSGEMTIDGVSHKITAGESIVMPAQHPHAVYAETNFKMILVVIFPEKDKQPSER